MFWRTFWKWDTLFLQRAAWSLLRLWTWLVFPSLVYSSPSARSCVIPWSKDLELCCSLAFSPGLSLRCLPSKHCRDTDEQQNLGRIPLTSETQILHQDQPRCTGNYGVHIKSVRFNISVCVWYHSNCLQWMFYCYINSIPMRPLLVLENWLLNLHIYAANIPPKKDYPLDPERFDSVQVQTHPEETADWMTAPNSDTSNMLAYTNIKQYRGPLITQNYCITRTRL